MTEYRIVPQFRNGCVIQGSLDHIGGLKEGDTVFLISKKVSKTTSILARIEGIYEGDENVIYTDQGSLGVLAEGDNVSLIKYNPAEAITVYLAISNDYTRVFPGDWTPVAKPSLKNRVIDFGSEISFMIPWEDPDGNELPPIPVSGVISATIPPPPVKIGLNTKIILNKFPEEKILKIKNDALMKQEQRVPILEKEAEHALYDKIQSMRTKNYPTNSYKYEFKNTDPKTLFEMITDVFKGLKVMEEKSEKLVGNNYLASIVYFIEEISGSPAIIDIQVMAQENSGELLVIITAKDDVAILELINKYDGTITHVTTGLEVKSEVLIAKCPNCDGDLPMEDVSADGIVTCLYCRSTCKLPKTYRY